jgi:hypothetical protein
MKRYFFSLLAVLAIVGIANAAAPSTVVGTDWELVRAGTNVLVTGTTAGNLVVKQEIKSGWEYVLVARDSVGAAADSAAYKVIVYGSDNTTVMGGATIGWGLTAIVTATHNIPIGTTLFGRSMTITFTRTEATNKTKVERWELYRRRPLTTVINADRTRN